jgi:aspartate/methionine/tyrosine aminotransferase
VTVDPDKEVIVTLGSKEGLANLAQAITAPGDVVLAPNPSYPIHTFGFIIAGAAIRSIPAAPGDDFFERLDRAVRYTVPRPKVLVVGYPSNPTAYVADLPFYERLIAFAREHELIVISDLAYAEIYFGETPTPSILQVEGAREVAVEFTSMSKTYSMAGWRIGFAVGNAAQRPAGHRRGQPRTLQETPRRPGRELRPRRLADPGATGVDVRLGADTRAIPQSRRDGILQAPADRGACRRRTRSRLRRGRRRLRPHRPGRE